jgi:hypothetical protein
MYEILLTRIFSVTMWYHFAFMAISLALFGMTFGAILVYLFPKYFSKERARHHLAIYSFLFAVSVVFSFMTHASIPFVTDWSFVLSPVWLFSVALTYVVIAVPFVFSGITVSLALTKFPKHVSRLYAVDLLGAAAGCIVLVYTLDFTDGPTSVFVVALLATLGALFFALGTRRRWVTRLAIVCGLLFGSFVLINTIKLREQSPLIRLIWVKGKLEYPPLYEQWNSFSRIRVHDNPETATKPFGWGLSPTYPAGREVRQLSMNIDATAGTVLTQFDGDLSKLDYLKYDVTNLAHYLKEDADVLVVGAGGGRDILSALVFDQKSVLGIEINQDIVKAVNERFGDFTGHLDQDPRVTFVVDEARSYTARTSETFDIIQVSFIDTWAATASGAFVLSESSLYTVEAWKVFLEHLERDGILTYSRWYFRDRPGEMYRLTALARTVLTDLGVKNPRSHILIVRHMQRGATGDRPDGVGTILVSKQPFSPESVDVLNRVSQDMQFDLVLTPDFALDETFATLASGENIDRFVSNYPLKIAPPTDDSPFFFHMLRLGDLFDRELWSQGTMTFNMVAVAVLGTLFIIVLVLTFLCIIVPLGLTTKKSALSGTWPLFIFFSGIGLGFMLVEISQMQRLNIFLGHPTYGLTVGLFALLLSSGLGSYSTQRIGDSDLAETGMRRFFLLVSVLVLFGILTPYVIGMFQDTVTLLRILVAVGILFPLGFFMGMAFPLGIKLAATQWAPVTPWFWGINGATSVCASVLAVIVALNWSISTSFWIGFVCYLVAIGAFIWLNLGDG